MILSPSKHYHSKTKNHARVSLPENAVFWMVLLLLSIGCICSLYEKAAGRAAAEAGSHPETVFKVDAGITAETSQKPRAALTFDAIRGNEGTRQIMDILAKYDVKATFFLTGKWAELYPEDVKYISSQGHELGNLSEIHQNMCQLKKEQIRQEIQTTHNKVKSLTGTDMTLFRPPYGDCDKKVISAAESMGYSPIVWDVDSLDWKDYGSPSIVSQVLEHPRLADGSIILFHYNAKYTPGALEEIIKELQKRGYALGTVSQLTNSPAPGR